MLFSARTEDMAEVEGAVKAAPERVTTHYWVCSAPFFETAVLVAPESHIQGDGISSAVKLRFFDADGYPVNEISVQYEPGQVGVVELESFMAACKFEAGLKHAHLEIEAAAGTQILCRIHTREGASIMGRPLEMNAMRRIFLPMVFSRDRFNFVAMLNHSSEEAIVRARFYCGKRSPEAVWAVPAKGARLISPSVEFADYIELGEEEKVQGYLRLGVKGSQTVGAQLIERSRGTKEGSFFGVLS